MARGRSQPNAMCYETEKVKERRKRRDKTKRRVVNKTNEYLEK